jgi:predicted nucleotidyltransferase
MNRQQAIDMIQRRRPELQAAGAAALYLFGSVARDEGNQVSDIDVAIDIDRRVKPHFSLLDISRIGLIVEDATGVPTDVLVRQDLQKLREPFEADAIRVY